MIYSRKSIFLSQFLSFTRMCGGDSRIILKMLSEIQMVLLVCKWIFEQPNRLIFIALMSYYELNQDKLQDIRPVVDRW